jgi:hypothetical protein
MTPTALSLQLLRREGFMADVVERLLPHARVRKDLFGFGDVLAVMPGEALLAVQATSGSNVAARLAKAKALPALRIWLGHRFGVWGWQLRSGRWTVRRVAFRAEDLVPVELTPRPRPRRATWGERQGSLFDGEAGRDGGEGFPRNGATARR